MQQLLNQLSTHLKNVIANSISLAASFSHKSVLPVHILYALLEQRGSVGSQILAKTSINRQEIYKKIAKMQPDGVLYIENKKPVTQDMLPPLNSDAKQALEKGMLLAYELSSVFVGTEHLLYGLLESKEKSISEILKKYNIDKDNIQNQIIDLVRNTVQFPNLKEMVDITNRLNELGAQDDEILQNLPRNGKILGKNKTKMDKASQNAPTATSLFTVNLTEKTIQKNIDPIIGREKEIDRLMHILSRRNKNNPILLGEPGVGKTAIVEGFAKKILQGDVPDILKNKKILSLDLTLLIAGTIYRGEFELRLKHTIDEISSNPNIILFIDEIHNIIGAGSNSGAMDAANMLKPALAKGNLRCIGATTFEEYKKYIASDPALERRFQSIIVDEPNKKQTLQILEGLKKHYGAYHNVVITSKAIESAVELSSKYIHDNFLPDKAIDLIDEAAASVRIKQKKFPLENKKDELVKKRGAFIVKKEEAIKNEQFELAIEFKEQKALLDQKINKISKQIFNSKKIPKKYVTEKNVADVLSKRMGIELSVLLKNKYEQLELLGKKLEEKIVGQEKAVRQIIQALQKAYLGLGQKNKPLTSLLFAGPSGTGKTEMAKVLAKELYYSDEALIKFDMSEFAEPHSISKILGSPAGYIGHKERNRFTDALKNRPNSVLLFDEIDKAHSDVIRLILQILDEGKITDSSGKKIYFHHCIILFTTNLGCEFFKSSGIGFGSSNKQDSEIESIVIGKLKEELGSEVLGRMETVCVFSPLEHQHVVKIIKKQIEKLNEHLICQNISVIPEKSAIFDLAKKSYSEDTGARDVKQYVTNTFAGLVADVLKKKTRKQTYSLKKVKDGYKLL